MAYDGGVITRKDIFENEALEVGGVYAKNLEQAKRVFISHQETF